MKKVVMVYLSMVARLEVVEVRGKWECERHHKKECPTANSKGRISMYVKKADGRAASGPLYCIYNSNSETTNDYAAYPYYDNSQLHPNGSSPPSGT